MRFYSIRCIQGQFHVRVLDESLRESYTLQSDAQAAALDRLRNDAEFGPAVRYFEIEAAAQRAYESIIARGKKIYGDHYNPGLPAYECWPAEAKRLPQTLQKLYNDAAYKGLHAKPPRRRMGTMHKVRYAVHDLLEARPRGNVRIA